MSDEWTATTGGGTVSRTSDQCGTAGRAADDDVDGIAAGRRTGSSASSAGRRRRPVEAVSQPVAPVHDIVRLIDDRRSPAKEGAAVGRFHSRAIPIHRS
jgi:hypothetical protein